MGPLTVYYVRHGETDWNVAGRLQGRRNVSLNAQGRAQAGRCGDILRGLFESIGRNPGDLDYVSSPLGRACETMDLMRSTLGLPPNGYRLEPNLPKFPSAIGKASRLPSSCTHAIRNVSPRASKTN